MRAATALIAAVLLMAATGCSRQGDASHGGSQPVLAVSIGPQAALLEALAGDDYEVVTLLPRGADPESYDPTPAQRRSVADARAFFTTGAFPFEQTVAASLPADVPVVDGSEGIEMIYGTHGGADNHSHPDPHIWTSVRNLRTMAAGMASQLAALNPAHSDIYRQRLDSLEAVLDSIDTAFADRLAAAPSRAFAVRHPSLSYFARDYGLRQHALGTEGKELSTPGLRRVIDAASADSVKVFFVDSPDQTERVGAVADGIGARVVAVNLLEPDWQSQLTRVVDAIARP